MAINDPSANADTDQRQTNRPLTHDPFRTTDVAVEGGIAPAEFGAKHDVHAMFVPFDCLPGDPLDALLAVKKVVAATPGTAQHITRSRVAKYLGLDTDGAGGTLTQRFPEEFFLVHGAYPCADISESAGSKAVHFANPTYYEQDELYSATDRDERIAWADRYTALGGFSYADVAPHFGITPRSAREWASRNDYPWQERKRQGRRTRARTFMLLREWGASWREIGDAFGMTPDAVRVYATEHHDGFEVPDDPTVRDV